MRWSHVTLDARSQFSRLSRDRSSRDPGPELRLLEHQDLACLVCVWIPFHVVEQAFDVLCRDTPPGSIWPY